MKITGNIEWFDLSADDGDFNKMVLEIKSQLIEKGIVFTRNLKSESDFSKLGEALGDIQNPRHEANNGRGIANIHCNPTLVGKGYTREELLFHTDRSGFENAPEYLLTTLKTQATSGGLSTFVDGKLLQETLKKEDEVLFSMLCDKSMTLFQQDDATYNNLPFFESTGKIRCRFDDKILFAYPLANKLPILFQFLEQCKLEVKLEEGEGYILDNHRWLHGRTEFTGKREVLRLLASNPDSKQIKRKLVLFDIDGTLVDSQCVSVAAFFKCLTKIMGKEITLENSSSVNLHGQTDLNLVTEVVKLHLEASNDDLDAIVKEFFQLHPSYLLDEINSNKSPIIECPGAVRLFERIFESREEFQKKGIHFGLLTGNSQKNAFAKLQSVGLRTEILDSRLSAFGDKYLIRSDMLPGAWESARQLGYAFERENTLIIGDTPLDINCAKTNNAKALAVATGSFTSVKLQTYTPDYLMQNFQDSEAVLEILSEF